MIWLSILGTVAMGAAGRYLWRSPLLRTVLLAAIVVASCVAGGFVLGAAHVTKQWAADKAKQAIAVAKVETKQADATVKVVTQYVDRVQVVREKGKTITQQVTKYVPLSAPDLPYGFRLLHDAAATGVPLPDAAVDLDGPAVSAQDVAATVSDNYAVCHAELEKLNSLQDWVSAQEDASE
jgi:co-chaperonin GroES (HSP10)